MAKSLQYAAVTHSGSVLNKRLSLSLSCARRPKKRKAHGQRSLRHDLPGRVVVERLPRGQQPRKLVAQLRPLPRDVRVLGQ